MIGAGLRVIDQTCGRETAILLEKIAGLFEIISTTEGSGVIEFLVGRGIGEAVGIGLIEDDGVGVDVEGDVFGAIEHGTHIGDGGTIETRGEEDVAGSEDAGGIKGGLARGFLDFGGIAGPDGAFGTGADEGALGEDVLGAGEGDGPRGEPVGVDDEAVGEGIAGATGFACREVLIEEREFGIDGGAGGVASAEVLVLNGGLITGDDSFHIGDDVRKAFGENEDADLMLEIRFQDVGAEGIAEELAELAVIAGAG